MSETSAVAASRSRPAPSLLRRIVMFPLVRLLMLGAPLLVLMGLAGDVVATLGPAPFGRIAGAALMAAIGIALYAGFVRFVERRAVSELAMPDRGRELLVGMAIGAGLYSAAVAVLVALGHYRILGLNPATFLLTAIPMAITSSVFEELIFRGVLFRITEEALGSWIALAISAFVFGFLHLMNPQGTIEGAIFITIEAGVLLAAAYMLTRRLWLSIGFHFAWNYTQSGIFSGIVSGGVSTPGLVQAEISGPELLTGGSFGVESSILAFVLCTGTGVWMLARAIRQGRLVAPWWQRGITDGTREGSTT